MFAHLHVHSTFSFLDGYGTADQYINRLKEIGQGAMAVTDHGNIFAHQTFYKEFKKNNLKFIPGCELYVKSPQEDEKKFLHITVLAKNKKGHENLCKGLSLASDGKHFYKKPRITLEELAQYQDGLIVLTGCFGNGLIHNQYLKNKELCLKQALFMKRLFAEVYLEIQHTGTTEEIEFFRLVGRMSGLQCVPTMDVHYPKREDFVFEDLSLCIGQKALLADATRLRLPDNLWLHSEKEALKHFTQEEIDLTGKIADSCNTEFEKLPVVRFDDARETMVEMVRKNSLRLGQVIKNEIYREKYRYEMSIIDTLGLHSYFVIMGDTISFFKRKGLFVGPARGSSAGSLVSYLMGITEVDPIKHNLSFERFIDVNRKDYPDIDTDFPHNARDSIVAYLRERYGEDRIGRITSYTRWAGASCFWDIARTSGVDSRVCATISKEIPHLVNDTMSMKDIVDIPAIKPILKKYPVFQAAVHLDGQVRQVGQHASGFVISPVDLSGIVAHHKMKDGHVISADKYQAEDMGFIKLDILGLTTLDMIQKIIEEVKITNESLYRLEPTNQKVFDVFNQKEVAGIFQFEGPAVKRALDVFRVDSLDDLAFINAVIRPGASNALSGDIDIPDCLRRFIFKGKYFVYQEELMAILRFLGFSWDDVTKIRKMVSKKQVAELEKKFKTQFIERCGSVAGIQPKQSHSFWEVINKCGEYMFNKSHAVSYAFLAYISAHLKITYPEVFVKHYMDMADDDKRREMLREYAKKGWTWKAADIAAKSGGFNVEARNDGVGSIIGGLASIKGIGAAKILKIQSGKPDKGSVKAIDNAKSNPVDFAPWCALEDFDNRYILGSLPEGDFIVRARAWSVKDGVALIEDKNGCEKCYFNVKYTQIEKGKVYDFAITKWKYCKIDSAREVK